MTIEAGALLSNPDRFRTTPGIDRSVAEPGQKPGRDDATADRSDRLQFSASALRRIFGKRFAKILQAASEHPEKLAKRAAKELGKEFRNAIRALKRAGVLDPSEAKALRKAYHEARKALREPADADSTTRIEASREARVGESRSYTLELRTAEGDLVTILLERSDQQAYSQQVTAGDGQTSFAERFTSSSSSSLTFRVEGELNDDERAAIEELVGRVDQLASRFFEGDTQAALEYGLQLGLQDPEIAGFSVQLGYSLEAYAARSYRAVQSLAAPEAEAEVDTAPVADLIGELRTLGSEARLETLFSETRSLVQGLFRGTVESDPRIAESTGAEEMIERLGRLLHAV